jgi:hypothetical protein
MAADTVTVKVGELDVSVSGRFITFDASPWTTGWFQYTTRYNPTIGSWACSIKRGIGGSPQAFGPALAFSSAVTSQPTGSSLDLTSTSTVVFTTDTAGTSGIVDIWFVGKADK